jgi:hypothetical protein
MRQAISASAGPLRVIASLRDPVLQHEDSPPLYQVVPVSSDTVRLVLPGLEDAPSNIQTQVAPRMPPMCDPTEENKIE